MARHVGPVTLMIIRDAESGPTTIRFPRPLWRFLIALGVVLAVTFIFESVTYFSLLSHSRERDELLVENNQLKSYTAKVQLLEKELRTNRIMLRKMTELAGIDLADFGLDQTEVLSDLPPIVALPGDTRLLPQADSGVHATPAGHPVLGWLSRSFRPQHDNPKMRHLGVDLAIATGTEVLATADGVVSLAAWDSTFGWTVIVDHAEDLQTMYGHNDSLLVRQGDNVHYGQSIALSGSTGISSAPHLHYEIRRGGEAIDPENYLLIEQIDE